MTRRRFVGITAAAAGLALVPFGAPRSVEAHLVSWNGVALGAAASLQIHHPDLMAARRLIEQAVAETRRLETIFSLYRDDSALAELNRTGILVAPPAELVSLLQDCDRFVRLSGGAFDPTVQPLWRCYADWFQAHGRGAAPPPSSIVEETLNLVGWDKVRVDRNRIALARRGMALTLNGVAQGFITDRVVDLLRDAGIDHSLVDMGEIRAIGDHPLGRPWQVRLDQAEAPGGSMSISLVDKAVATTAASGFSFDDAGRCNHLFDPHRGTCALADRALSVVAGNATDADALSTAFSLMPDAAIRAALSQVADARVYSLKR